MDSENQLMVKDGSNTNINTFYLIIKGVSIL